MLVVIYTPCRKVKIYEQNIDFVFHKVVLFSGSGPCHGSNVNCQVRNPDLLSDPFIKMCDCVLEEQTELWSMQKSRFIPSSLQLPFGISSRIIIVYMNVFVYFPMFLRIWNGKWMWHWP